MSTTDSTDFLLTRDNIIVESMELCGVLRQNAVPTTAEYTSFARTLNTMVKSLQSYGVMLWTIDESQQQLLHGSKIVGSDGNAYLCIKRHTATTGNQPITGPLYPSFWLQIGSVSDWETEESYVIGNTIDSDGANTYYRCVKDHTSDATAFATDLALNYWETADWAADSNYEAMNHIVFDLNIIGIDHGVYMRDNVNVDYDVKIIDRIEYNSIAVKTVIGIPNRLFVMRDRRFDNQQSVGTYTNAAAYAVGERVTGTDGNIYECTAAIAVADQAVDKPITGTAFVNAGGYTVQNQNAYWKEVSPTEGLLYPLPNDDSWIMNYPQIRLVENFDASGDHPDFPIRWIEALTWGLAERMSYKYSLPLDERDRIEAKAKFFMKVAIDDSNDSGSIQFGIERGYDA